MLAIISLIATPIVLNTTDGTHTYSGTDRDKVIVDSNILVVSPIFLDRILQYKSTNNSQRKRYFIDDYV